MELVPVLCEGNDSKRFDGRMWWEDISTITEVNGKEVNKTLDKSQLQNGDKVVIKFGDKSKKLFKGIIQFPSTDLHTAQPLEVHEKRSCSLFPVHQPATKKCKHSDEEKTKKINKHADEGKVKKSG